RDHARRNGADRSHLRRPEGRDQGPAAGGKIRWSNGGCGRRDAALPVQLALHQRLRYNTGWKPYDTDGVILANGNRSADYWNQQFLVCWRSSWPEANAWAFLSNATGEFIDFNNTYNYTADVVPNLQEPWFSQYAKVRVCNYDGNWI